ncbi:hypothetical protein ACFV3O_21285, partial [Streptomyces albidoflavus]
FGAGRLLGGSHRGARCRPGAWGQFLCCGTGHPAWGFSAPRLSVVDEKLKILERHRLELANRIALLRSGAGADDFDALLKQVQQA